MEDLTWLQKAYGPATFTRRRQNGISSQFSTTGTMMGAHWLWAAGRGSRSLRCVGTETTRTRSETHNPGVSRHGSLSRKNTLKRFCWADIWQQISCPWHERSFLPHDTKRPRRPIESRHRGTSTCPTEDTRWSRPHRAWDEPLRLLRDTRKLHLPGIARFMLAGGLCGNACPVVSILKRRPKFITRPKPDRCSAASPAKLLRREGR